MRNENLQLINALKGTFFPVRQKTFTVVGQVANQQVHVYNHLKDNQVLANPGDIIITGVVGESWVESWDSVSKKYECVNGRSITKELLLRGPTRLKTKSDGPLQYASRVDADRMFILIAGPSHNNETMIANRPGIEHAKGDCVVCSASPDGKQPNFKDMWVVNGEVFRLTYKHANRV